MSFAGPSFAPGARTSPSSCFLVHSVASREDSGSGAPGGGGSLVEMLSVSSASSVGSFPVSSLVSGGGGGGGGTGRIDLLSCWPGFVCATFSDSARVVAYSLQSPAKHMQATMPERARAMLVDPLGRFLLLASHTGRLRAYELATGALVCELRTSHDRGINCLAMDGEARVLVAGGEDGVMSGFDFGAMLQQGALGKQSAASSAAAATPASPLVFSVADHSLAISSVTVSPGNMLLTSSKDGGVRLYRLDAPLAESSGASGGLGVQTPSLPCVWSHSFRGAVQTALLDPTECVVYAAVKDSVHWRSLYASHAGEWKGHRSALQSMALCGGRLLSLDAEGELKLWEASTSPPSNLPSIGGTVLKSLARRVGCKTVLCVSPAPQRQASVHAYLAQHASKAGAQGSAQAGKDTARLFPSLHGSAPPPLLYLPLRLGSRSLNQETQGGLVRAAEAGRKRRWDRLEAAWDEVESSGHGGEGRLSRAVHAERSEDFALLCGSSPWSHLAESVSARGSSLDALQSQRDAYAEAMAQIYDLCVDNTWKEIHASRQ